MPATYETQRRCPYCAERIRLSEAPIVATNYDGVQYRDPNVPVDGPVELPSGMMPLRVLERTGWPVIGQPPSDELPAEPQRRQSALAKTFLSGRGRAMELAAALIEWVSSGGSPSARVSELRIPAAGGDR